MTTPTPPTAPKRSPRTDGDTTRLHILETAGQLFAERGFANATSKEICTRAGTNMASINYHFGSRDGLYEAVLVAAHQHKMAMETVTQVVGAEGDPRQKLRMLVGGLIGKFGKDDWGPRVLMRELAAPTEFAHGLIEQAIAPKARMIIGLISQIMQLPPSHIAVQRALALLMTQCMGLLLAPANGALPFSLAKDAETLPDDVLSYALAGFESLRQRYGSV